MRPIGTTGSAGATENRGNGAESRRVQRDAERGRHGEGVKRRNGEPRPPLILVDASACLALVDRSDRFRQSGRFTIVPWKEGARPRRGQARLTDRPVPAAWRG
jgi:hypothetical protein